MKTRHLQGIGNKPAIPAKELKVGTIILWNYGYTSEVLDIVPSKSGKTLIATTKSESGNIYQRRFNADKLVAIA